VSPPLKRPQPNKGKAFGLPGSEKESTGDESFHQTPVFCFLYLEAGFDIDSLDDKEKAMALKRINKMRKMKWQDIMAANRHGLGYEKIAYDSIKVGIPSIITPDVNILAFRCFNMMPMLGWKNGRILHLVWFDPHGKVYDHG